MFARVSRSSVLLGAAVHGVSVGLPGAGHIRRLSLAARSFGDEQALRAPRVAASDPKYTAWLEELRPRLADLDHLGLHNVLLEAEKRLPQLPGHGFMKAWFEAALPAMSKMTMPTWELAEKLGGFPSEAFLRAFGLVARDMQRRSPRFAMHDMLDLQYRWGGTEESMRPFLEAWEDVQTSMMRRRGRLRTGTTMVFQEIGYTVGNEFTGEWIRAASRGLREDMSSYWQVMNSAVTMPVEDVRLLFPLLDEFTRTVPPFEGNWEKKVLNTLIGMADAGYQPPAEWIAQVSSALLEQMPKVKERRMSSFFKALSGVASPLRDRDAMTNLAAAWTSSTLAQLCQWPAHCLVDSLGALIRLQLGPSEIGREWFHKWLQSARAFCAGSNASTQELAGEELVEACRKIAVSIVVPTRWNDLALRRTGRALRSLRELRDFHDLKLSDPLKLRNWLDSAKDLDSFRNHQVEHVAQYLRSLGADAMAREWEQFNAEKR